MSHKKMNRRRFLTSTAGTGLFMQSLNNLLLPSKLMAQDKPPLRFVTFYNPHGTLKRKWRPKALNGSAYHRTEFTFNYPDAILQPLEAFKNKMIFLDGFDYRILYQNQGTGHYGGLGCALTGANGVNYGGSILPLPEQCTKGSVDQIIANLEAQFAAADELLAGLEAQQSLLTRLFEAQSSNNG